MFVCVVSLSQPSSRDLLYVKCLCVLSRYLNPVVESVMLYVKCVCVVSLSQPSSNVCVCYLVICYMLNVCVCCLVISTQ